MKKVLIIEDEYYSAHRLMRLVSDVDDTLEVHGPLKSVAEVVAELTLHNDYDLILSDIRLSDGEVFDAFRAVMPQSFVIFTTAYDEYAMQAIKHNGLDYLMKPIDSRELEAAMHRLQQLTALTPSPSPEPMQRLLADTHRYRERFLISKGDELKVVEVAHIHYICMENGRVLAHTDDGSSYPLPRTMAELEGELDPDRFFRLNRQYIASIGGIRRIGLFFNSKLTVHLKGCADDNIVVSKEKTALLREWLDR